MNIPIYQVDAFTSQVFSGNPAAVCPLDSWIDDELMQCIAAENNLSETAFLVQSGDGFELRWFTPVTGSAHCVLTPYWTNVLGKNDLHALQVSSRGGELFCTYAGERVKISGRAVLYLEGTIEV